MTPLLSCVIRSTRSRAHLFERTVEMLRGYARNAAVPPFELILALDADDDWCPWMHEDIPWHVVRVTPRQPHEAVWQHLHRKYVAAFAAAVGQWIVCVDDDDWFGFDRLTMLACEKTFDVVSASRVYVHELRSPHRRTYQRTAAPLPALLESTLSFRRRLLDEIPLVDSELGLWVGKVPAARVTCRHMTHVMFLHGTNADLGVGRTELRVGPNDDVYDGPVEYKVIGARGVAAELVGEAELRRWEAAVG